MFSAHFEAHHDNGWGYIIEPLFLDLESTGDGVDRFAMDVALSGPIVGVNINW